LNTPAAEFAVHRERLQAAADAAGLVADEIGEIINSRPELPRPLLAEERTTLLALLNYADFEGRDALLEQAELARANWLCACGCASVNLEVDSSAPSCGKTYRPIPNEAEVLDAHGESIGGIIVFADDGYLSNLEVYWHFEPISPFPSLERLRLYRQDS
jgi:hypothetical protein